MKTMLIYFVIVILVVMLTSKSVNESEVPIRIKPSDDTVQSAVKLVNQLYGSDIARNVERMFRLETAHFKSGGYLKTYGAGTEAHSENYPYGWKSMQLLWDNNPEYKPTGIVRMKENVTGIEKKFLKFPTVTSAMLSLAEFLKKYDNNAGRYFSLQKNLQDEYNNKLSGIRTPFFNNLT